MHGTERIRSPLGTVGNRLLACAALAILPLVLVACAAATSPAPTPVQVAFASANYEGVEGYGVRVVVRLDRSPGRVVEIPLRVDGVSEHRLWEQHGGDGSATGERRLRSVSAVSFGSDETEKAIFLQVNSLNDPTGALATIRLGTLPDAVEADSPSSAEVKIHAAPEELETINNLTMPHPQRADREAIGMLDVGEVVFAEFAFANDNFASTTAMSWKETTESSNAVTDNIDVRLSYMQIFETDGVRLQMPVVSQCPGRKKAPPDSEWPCVIDDIAEPAPGLGMISASSHILQARLRAGRYQIRVEAVSMPGPYRVTIHFNEEVECYEAWCMDDDD